MWSCFFFILFIIPLPYNYFFFFFNDTATTEIYTLSLHDALPISTALSAPPKMPAKNKKMACWRIKPKGRSEEHTSELQSQSNLVCRLLLEKKKKKTRKNKNQTDTAKLERDMLWTQTQNDEKTLTQ